MKVAHDRHIPDVRESLPRGTDLLAFDPRLGPSVTGGTSERDPDLIRMMLECDALLIRTVTKVTPETFPELESPRRRLSFIGSATAGVDHVDADWLGSLGIRFASSPGCNAMAVAEYVATALLAWVTRSAGPDADYRWSPDLVRGLSIRVGVIGTGHAGGAAANLLRSLGFDVSCYDPPRARRDPSFRSCTWEEIAACDVITLHVPLTKSGDEATRGWITPGLLASLRAKLVIQASRGGVLVESDASELICDVWEHEPVFSDGTARHAFLATPHIAGYSIESKQRATQGVCQALIQHAGFDLAGKDGAASDGPGDRPAADPVAIADPPPDTLFEALMRLHPIGTYDQALRACIGKDARSKSACFQSIRDTFPLRREYPSLRVRVDWLDRFPILADLGVGAMEMDGDLA